MRGGRPVQPAGAGGGPGQAQRERQCGRRRRRRRPAAGPSGSGGGSGTSSWYWCCWRRQAGRPPGPKGFGFGGTPPGDDPGPARAPRPGGRSGGVGRFLPTVGTTQGRPRSWGGWPRPRVPFNPPSPPPGDPRPSTGGDPPSLQGGGPPLRGAGRGGAQGGRGAAGGPGLGCGTGVRAPARGAAAAAHRFRCSRPGDPRHPREAFCVRRWRAGGWRWCGSSPQGPGKGGSDGAMCCPGGPRVHRRVHRRHGGGDECSAAQRRRRSPSFLLRPVLCKSVDQVFPTSRSANCVDRRR